MTEKYPSLKAFSQHGVKFTRASGDTQAVGDCPFCKGTGHFYVNHQTKNWDCKKCQRHGGFAKFLEEMGTMCAKYVKRNELKVLFEEKGILPETFTRWQVGYNYTTQRYTIPVPNIEYGLSDLRLYKLGDKVHSSRDSKVNILNVRSLMEDRYNRPVYVCEGDWDFMVMDEILHVTRAEGLAIGIPGAGMFKAEWIRYFRNKTVHVLYDNDDAGRKGENRMYNALKAVAKKMTFVHWPEGKEDGYDLRDFYRNHDRQAGNTLAALRRLFKPEPRKTELEEGITEESQGKRPTKAKAELVPYKDVIAGYMKWLHIPNADFLNVIYGTILANRLQGEPIWLFLVAPPGSSKSVSLMSFQHADRIVTTTSITPHALISGFSGAGGDPSLIPRLDGKVLIIKDFTTVLSMPIMQREEIFGILRDAYDGRVEKHFGNMVMRAYDSKFGLVCGVTPAIDTLGEMHSSLGERFIKYRYKYDDWYQVIKRALGNSNHENQIRTELADLATRALAHDYESTLPEISAEVQESLITLAQWTAVMRGCVTRDRYTGDIIYKPSPEIGTRLVKQFSKLALGLAMFRGVPEVVHDDYQIIVQVARDTLTEKNEEIYRKMFLKDSDKKWSVKEIAELTRLPEPTCGRVLQDLAMLRILEKDRVDRVIVFSITDYAKELTNRSKVYKQY